MKKEMIIKGIKEKIELHSKLYRFPVKAELWEDILDQVLNPKNDNWSEDMGNHSSGGDVESNGISYQCKSGSLNWKTNSIKWNGHRTTKLETISEKVDFISEKHCDRYAFLARDSKWKENKDYYLIIVDSDFLNYKSMNWSVKMGRNGSQSGWEANSENYSALISKSMSDQLWTSMDIDYLKTKALIFEKL